MSLTIQLSDESGHTEEELFDEGRLQLWLGQVPELESTHCLQYIDLYGDTTFNNLQAQRFLEEWRLIDALPLEASELKLASAIAGLASRCAHGAHLYLKFVGD